MLFETLQEDRLKLWLLKDLSSDSHNTIRLEEKLLRFALLVLDLQLDLILKTLQELNALLSISFEAELR